jgi:hypothetical protein
MDSPAMRRDATRRDDRFRLGQYLVRIASRLWLRGTARSVICFGPRVAREGLAHAAPPRGGGTYAAAGLSVAPLASGRMEGR